MSFHSRLSRFGRGAHVAVGLAVALVACVRARGAERQTVDLGGSGWRLWEDREANWQDDELFVHPPELSKLPEHAPTGGWGRLAGASGTAVKVPGTAEEYLLSGPTVGDVTGVTWWWRDVEIPAGAGERNAWLEFDAARQRAEVYLDGKLVGYDLVGNTPFRAELGKVEGAGRKARLAMRITDPGGNFDWHDKGLIPWGKNKLLMSHGFGGVTGPVRLVIADGVAVDDLYVQNTREFRTVNVEATIRNSTSAEVTRAVRLRVASRGEPGKVVAEVVVQNVTIPAGGAATARATLSAPEAALWDTEHPNLYRCEAAVLGGETPGDAASRTFGFRWFEPVGVGKDAMFRLNGKRIVLRSAISWGFFPINGLYATPEMAEKQIRAAKAMGLNMLSFHRCVGQTAILDKADELGLLYYEEPGNYASGADAREGSIPREMAREKLVRMVRRDRSHPSLIIYNMSNESSASGDTLDHYVEDMRAAHALDPSRTITCTSGLRSTPGIDVELANKYHMRPFDDEVHRSGWYDDHHAGGLPVWGQSGYVSPKRYLQRVSNKQEIVYWGEEGALSTPPRLGLIEADLKKAPQLGWDGPTYHEWYARFDRFLDEKSLRSAFPTVDDLCVAMGNISMEHQGHRIEAIRINDDTDGYAINGWESEILENHSGIVDCFRNPKGDPAIMARFNRPTYVAVMPRTQVLPAEGEAVVDLYAINETNLTGPHVLHVLAEDERGTKIFEKQLDVTLAGGDVYGQLLAEDVRFPVPPTATGMIRVSATLTSPAGAQVADGWEKVLAVDWRSRSLGGSGAVFGGGDTVGAFLRKRKGLAAPDYMDGMGRLDWIVASASPDASTPLAVPATQLRGVTATFFSDAEFKEKAVQRKADTVELTAPDGAPPDPAVNTLQHYSVRWEGQVIAPETGDYTFGLDLTGRGEVFVDGQPVFSHDTTAKNSKPQAKPAHLTAGQAATLKVEWRQPVGDARCRLLWVPPAFGAPDPKKLLDRVRTDGTTLIVLANADRWAALLHEAEPKVGYAGSFTVGKAWSGGVHFVRSHPLFAGLPANCGMDWPYQSVVREGTSRSGLLLDGDELVAGAFHAHSPLANPPAPMQLGTAVGIVPLGKGRVILSTLDIEGNLNAPPGPADVARKLLCNFVNYAATSAK